MSKEGSKADLRICKNREEVEANLLSLGITKEVLIEQYIDRDYEISILGVALEDGECIMPAIEHKLTLFPKYVGLECLAKIEEFTPCELKERLMALVKRTGYVGPFSIEMMHNKQDGAYYFTEINLRNDGANSFIYKCGVNLPLIHINDLTHTSNENVAVELKRSGYYIWDFHHFKSLLHKDIGFGQWISEIVKCKGFLAFYAKDPKPFFKQYINWISRKKC